MKPQVTHPLSYHRRLRLLSQRDLSRITGINAATIYIIENSKSTPRLVTIRKICDALDIEWQQVSEFVAAVEQQEAKS